MRHRVTTAFDTFHLHSVSLIAATILCALDKIIALGSEPEESSNKRRARCCCRERHRRRGGRRFPGWASGCATGGLATRDAAGGRRDVGEAGRVAGACCDAARRHALRQSLRSGTTPSAERGAVGVAVTGEIIANLVAEEGRLRVARISAARHRIRCPWSTHRRVEEVAPRQGARAGDGGRIGALAGIELSGAREILVVCQRGVNTDCRTTIELAFRQSSTVIRTAFVAACQRGGNVPG
eukprot:SAG31_NODE_3474_length_4233_cov_5.560716_4_plen_239_part_00